MDKARVLIVGENVGQARRLRSYLEDLPVEVQVSEDAAAAIIMRQSPLLRGNFMQRRAAHEPLKAARHTIEPLDGSEPFLIAEPGGGDR